jgi:hypothetical protein
MPAQAVTREHWRGRDHRIASAAGGEGIAVGIQLANPEQVRIVPGAVQGIQQCAWLFLRLLQHWPERGDPALIRVTGLVML